MNEMPKFLQNEDAATTEQHVQPSRSIVPRLLFLGSLAIIAVCGWRFGLTRYQAWQEERNKPVVVKTFERIEKVPGGTPILQAVEHLPQRGDCILGKQQVDSIHAKLEAGTLGQASCYF